MKIGMETRKRKRNQKGGQPLSYTNPYYPEPAALPGAPILYSNGMIARPEIPMQSGGAQMVYTDIGQWVPYTQQGTPLIIQRPQQGGAQPLSYTNVNYPEPAALPGAPILYSNGMIARPEIAQKGGFTPSIMSNLVQNGAYLTPLAVTAGYRLWSNRKTRKQRGGNGEEWEAYRQQARGMLEGLAPGKVNGKWINKVAKALKEKKNTAAVLAEFQENKGVEGQAQRPRFATRLNEWEYNQRQAKKELKKYGEPTGAEITHLAALRTGRKGKAGDAEVYVEQFRQRYQAAKEKKAASEQEKEEKRIKKEIEQAEKAIPKAPKPKPVFNDRPWQEIRQEAKDELRAMGKKMIRGNVMHYASLKRTKDEVGINKFLEDFRQRPDFVPKHRDRAESKEMSETEEEFKEDERPRRPPRVPKPRKGREEWEGYQSGAKKMLEKIGPPTIAEISVLAKMMKDGENIRPYLNDFEGRVKQTEIRVAKLEKERQEREASDSKEEPEEVKLPPPPPRQLPPPPPARIVTEVQKPKEEPQVQQREDVPMLPPKPLVAQPPHRPPMGLMPVDPGKLAKFKARLEELSKKYPGQKQET